MGTILTEENHVVIKRSSKGHRVISITRKAETIKGRERGIMRSINGWLRKTRDEYLRCRHLGFERGNNLGEKLSAIVWVPNLWTSVMKTPLEEVKVLTKFARH